MSSLCIVIGYRFRIENDVKKFYEAYMNGSKSWRLSTFQRISNQSISMTEEHSYYGVTKNENLSATCET